MPNEIIYYSQGATVRNDGERVIVGRVVKGGIAEKSRLLQEGDEILEVNGVDLRGKSVTEVCDMLRSITGEVTFVIAPNEDTSKNSTRQLGSKAPAPVVQHMRAMFDYEPEDDFYVPCKELALKFQKGDILHVISMSDENWWQAYREGDDPSQNLAGLIPSANFQQQVIQYNREMEKETEPIGVLKSDKQLFGCAKKQKERKKKLQKVTVLGGTKEVRPLDEIISENDDDIFTYEEVSLYLSRTGRKRPIVLCGPEGVGCLELRQKLMEYDKDKYAGVVPHTSRPKRPGEQDGVHYHFVTKQSFQDDSRLGKFIEWGEYQKHYYGTSFGSVKAVVERGKICLLTLKAQSLKALRSSDLLPYVIFVSPPALQQLKRQKEKQGLHNV
uniref:Uncharacterized protein n=1 Tax=Plectus sambesii TaxID=2011161 RepID=A0A914UUC9_9BILA